MLYKAVLTAVDPMTTDTTCLDICLAVLEAADILLMPSTSIIGPKSFIQILYR